MVKKILIVLGSLFVLIIAAAILIPIIFKDDIKAAIDEEIAKSVNADVIFNTDNLSISLFSNFPNLTVGLSEFGVINREPFAGEILLAVQNFEVEVNLKSVLFDDNMRIKGITLNHPEIFVKVLEDGTANYDIAIPAEEDTTTVVVEDTIQAPAEDFTFGIDRWEITEGHIVYDDATIPVFAEIKGLNHSGSGDFSLAIFDLDTYTKIDSLTVIFDGTNYLNKKTLMVDMVLNMDLDQSKFTFKNNSIGLNEFLFGFDGWFSMPEDGFDMDLTFSSQDNSFKSLLSLVPAVYTQDFESIKTDGNLSFSGAVKGKYTETTMPAFNLALLVEEAMLQYPDLPSSVKNINIDTRIDNPSGNIDETVVDVKKFHMEFGSNPIDARLLVKNLVNYPIDANIKASLNLGELGTMFPIEGLEMKGKFNLDATAKGVYDSIKSIIPAIKVAMSMQEGYIKSEEFPIPMEDITLQTSITNESGKMAETYIDVSEFRMKMGEEDIAAKATVENLDDYTWDVSVNGGIDIGKIMEIFPQEGMSLAGKIYADIKTSGKMSDLEAERYDRLPTSGSVTIADFNYTDNEYLAMGFNISDAKASFDPEKIVLSTFKGNVGNTDMSANGAISNYMNYVLKNELLQGNLNYQSKLVDVNQFMTTGTTEEEEEEAGEEAPMEVVPIPKNIDFVLHSRIDRIVYDNMSLTNARGDVIIRDGVMDLKNLAFNMLGGSFVTNGRYDTRDIENPTFDFDLDIQNVSIQQSYATFNTIQTLAPIAQNVNGNVSTKFKLSGALGQDMMPVMSSLNGGGLLNIASAAVSNSKLVSGITSLTKLDNSSDASIKDLIMSATIKDGRFSVKPFDIKLGNYQTNVSGSTGLDGGLDYSLLMDIPAGKVGTKVNSTLTSLTGNNVNDGSTITLNIGVGGTYDDPKPVLLAADTKEAVKQQLTEKAKDVVKDQATDLLKDQGLNNLIGTKDKNDSTKTALSADSLKKSIAEKNLTNEDSAKKAVDDAKDKIKSLFKKKKNN